MLAFEYGYATAEPRTLLSGKHSSVTSLTVLRWLSTSHLLWRAEMGPDVWSGDVAADGYEGQGPEHSSARLERYLQFALSKTCRFAYLLPRHRFTTAASSGVARDASSTGRDVAETLLRHPLAVSSLEELANGTFCQPSVKSTSLIRRVLSV